MSALPLKCLSLPAFFFFRTPPLISNVRKSTFFTDFVHLPGGEIFAIFASRGQDFRDFGDLGPEFPDFCDWGPDLRDFGGMEARFRDFRDPESGFS